MTEDRHFDAIKWSAFSYFFFADKCGNSLSSAYARSSALISPAACADSWMKVATCSSALSSAMPGPNVVTASSPWFLVEARRAAPRTR
jgi:hypothetical protein